MMVTVRALRANDLPALVEIERSAPTAAHWRDSEYQNLLTTDEKPRRITLVAEKDGKPAGFVVAKVVAGEWEIENIIVRADCQRQGIGAQLLSGLVREASQSDAQQILLEVRAQNSEARNLYVKCGFSVVGRRRAYYHDPEDDAVLYRLVP
jgi:tRNA threonylcarbamoyladenosine biosynthesis protein TsaB